MRQRQETPDGGPVPQLIGRTYDCARIDRLLHLKLDMSSRDQLHHVVPIDLTMV